MSTLGAPDYADANLGLEPLPDVDFNIRAGNTLVGFATRAELQKGLAYDLDGQAAEQGILEQADVVAHVYAEFKHNQDTDDQAAAKAAKAALNKELDKLNLRLNKLLHKQNATVSYDDFCHSYQPFHWFAEFYEIVTEKGGFDVIIGNPPYLEFRQINYQLTGYLSTDSNAVHAVCMERSTALLHPQGAIGMIVPLSLVSTQRMKIVQQVLEKKRTTWYANFSWRPAKLFDTVNRALTIFISLPASTQLVYATNYLKWGSDIRDGLLQRVAFGSITHPRKEFWVAKISEPIEEIILKKMLGKNQMLSHSIGKTGYRVYYRTTGGLYWKIFTDEAPSFEVNGIPGHSTRETWLTMSDKNHVQSAVAALSSNTFWWWYSITSNCRDMNPFDVQNFPLPVSTLNDTVIQELGKSYLKDIKGKSRMLTRIQKQTGETRTQSFKISQSKSIIDEIDNALARHYGFTPEELDFIINYDIKYRMGAELDDEE